MKSFVTGIAVGLFLAASGIAQAGTPEKGWLDVNLGVASAAENTRNTQSTWIKYRETASLNTTYKQPTGADFDFGGGFMFTPIVGAGVSFSGTAHKSPADMTLTIPHPTLYNRAGTGTAKTESDLNYTEGAVHLQVMIQLPTNNDKLRVRFFAGPTHFRAAGDAITQVVYDQSYTYFGGNSVTITNFTSKEVVANAWGFHGGADVSYFFNKVIGIGGLVRVSRGSVKVEDADVMADEPMDIKLGGVQAAFGVRLRFGKK